MCSADGFGWGGFRLREKSGGKKKQDGDRDRDRVRDSVSDRGRDRVGSFLGPRPPWPVPRGVEGPN